MGYHTTVDFDLQLKIPVEEFEEKLEARKKQCKEDYWQHEDINCDEKGYLRFDEGYRKFYDEEELTEFLTPIVKEGYINCKGDEGEEWRYYFNGKGDCIVQNGEIIFDFIPYKEFMKSYGHELPKKLKTKIEEWWTAREL